MRALRLSNASSLLLHLLRGLAAQAVLVGHGLSFFGVYPSVALQGTGVAVFFVLSGIVIPYSSYLKHDPNGESSFKDFFIDRFSRIYMGLVPALIFVALCDSLSKLVLTTPYPYGEALNWRTFWGNLLMLQDNPVQMSLQRLGHWPAFLPEITSFGSARPLWTVAIEWWIYMFFGWVAFGFPHRMRRPFTYWMMMAVLLIVPFYNWVLNGRGHGLTAMWGMGLVIYLLLRYLQAGLSRRMTLLLVLGFVASGVLRVVLTKECYDPLYVGLLAVALYFGLDYLQRADPPCPKPLAWVIVANANFSYTLYLVHYTVLDVYVRWSGPGVVHCFLSFIVANLVSIVMFYAFERRYRKLAGALRARFG